MFITDAVQTFFPLIKQLLHCHRSFPSDLSFPQTCDVKKRLSKRIVHLSLFTNKQKLQISFIMHCSHLFFIFPRKKTNLSQYDKFLEVSKYILFSVSNYLNNSSTNLLRRLRVKYDAYILTRRYSDPLPPTRPHPFFRVSY